MSRPRALVLYARSVPAGLHRSIADTVVTRLRVTPERVPKSVRRNRYVTFWLEDYSSMSYMSDWREAFRSSPDLSADFVNVNDLLDLPRARRRITDYDLVLILHSAAGDNLGPLRKATKALQQRHGPLTIFFGNEIDHMPDKIGFAKEVGAEFIATQLPIAASRWLYAECPTAKVLAAPAALNPTLFHPAGDERPIDIGFRGALYGDPFAIGDEERTDLLRYFEAKSSSMGLVSDIKFERHPAAEWADFLNQCKGTIGAESGTYYLERDDAIRNQVITYVSENPKATFKDVFERFFAPYQSPVSGKTISSRHFEPIGTKTCQILLDGEYNGILLPDVHYIRLLKDYSNIDDVVRAFRDDGYRSEVADRALEHVLANHTYAHRVESLLKTILGR